MKRLDEIRFSEDGKTWTTAYFIQELGIVSGVEALSIQLRGCEWVVKRSEVMTLGEHNQWLKAKFINDNSTLIHHYNDAKVKNKSAIAKVLEMKYGTVLRLLKKAKEFGLLKA